ncbi:tetrapyrrole biosynthesis, uroporphyrinogen III synthase [Cutaneotrichosporon oleaginosum]|uniref:Tetrapyrrole biosynthesis, uroporphyrinogen III synthase n=1 Tax=Cutaneotrichosporon oleaginosum TaxID=879819 RepID=A0A0J1B4Y6_9TREE|nr:tetrapyrrole biosynthesis, uroporphyrinogen III synthase [Cutaneotrichosporon oleaginosum]KLT42754.1 tetrapyrrole biosynthesis, uroporphyrinogen III synthase [Cutaneotrichosporon oleaginosum]TXT09527.1 hypothetical protein COLE_03461 [Cutaneotrichosporon oleaginosum]
MRVFLFRKPALGDTYMPAFAAAGYEVTSLPALEDTLLPDALEPVLARGGGAWEAVIITSRRAAEAWIRAADAVAASVGALDEPWSAVPVWSPGPAVHSVFAHASLPPAFVPSPAPTAVSAAALAPLILAAPPRSSRSGDAVGAGYRPYLVLAGDKTLPLLTDSLRGAGRAVERVKVYETREAPGLAAAVRALPPQPGWVALFSPSSAGFVLPHLEAAGFRLREGVEGRTRVAAIGETTEAALREGGWRVDAVARTPDAAGLVAAIAEAEGRQADSNL